jgi:uncharacterized membrane protein YdjX (TVP38/TMEM64 family)
MSNISALVAALLTRVQQIGPWGAVVLGAAYIPAAILFVPGSFLTLGAGFLFGPVKGTLVVSLGSTAGAAAAFIVARRVAHDWVSKHIAGWPKLAAISDAVEHDAFKVVLLTRLSPVFPFNVLNYAFGLTSVRFSSYILASWIGMLPGTIMYVLLGSAAGSLAVVLSGEAPRSSGQQALLVVGLLAAVLVAVMIGRSARRALDRTVTES